MFVDELSIFAAAGNGGNGVERWLREQHRPFGGPAGGNGGNGGDVFVRAVRNLNQLAKYTGVKAFYAEHGEPGHGRSQHGKHGADLTIDVPVGSTITVLATNESYELLAEGETVRILKGGRGGLGNEMFKSSTNRSPTETTKGRPGEQSEITIVLSLVVDVGIIGLPNAGKSTLINALTNARSRVGAYPFTTLAPHLGDLYGFVLADIPGLIEGASAGKGLGHRFLRHVQKTNMLLHCVALDTPSPADDYHIIRAELAAFDSSLSERPEWVVLTKSDLVREDEVHSAQAAFEGVGEKVFVVSEQDLDSLKVLRDALVQRLRQQVP